MLAIACPGGSLHVGGFFKMLYHGMAIVCLDMIDVSHKSSIKEACSDAFH